MASKEQIKKELQNAKAVLQCAEQFGLVGNPTRMKICWLLCKHKELSVGEIAKILDVSVSTVSHSLKGLWKHELVAARRDYKQVFYRLTDVNFIKVLKNTLTNL